MNRHNELKTPLWRYYLKRSLPPVLRKLLVKVKTFLLLKLIFLPSRTIRMIFKSRTILFYPLMPDTENSVIAKICYVNGYGITGNTGQKFNLAINWNPCTYPPRDETLTELTSQREVINAECGDLSKKHLDSVFKDIFGYSIMLDPILHRGECVVKSDENARHDGRLVTCPLKETEKGVVYQKVVNNRCDGDLVQDIRVPVFGEKIPFVYLKYRPAINRFGNENKYVSIAKPSEALSEEEIKKIILFCKKMNLEYGELDTARDKESGRLYILDTNNTPWGPPNHISAKDYRRALRLLAGAFDEVFLKESG